MPDGERLDDSDVHAIHLFERERVIEIRLLAHDRVQLPFHQIGGQALGIGHRGAIEFAEIRQAAARQVDAGAAVRVGFRRQRPFETLLVLAREIAGGGGEIGIPADPFGGEVAEKIVDRTRLRADVMFRGDRENRRHARRNIPTC